MYLRFLSLCTLLSLTVLSSVSHAGLPGDFDSAQNLYIQSAAPEEGQVTGWYTGMCYSRMWTLQSVFVGYIKPNDGLKFFRTVGTGPQKTRLSPSQISKWSEHFLNVWNDADLVVSQDEALVCHSRCDGRTRGGQCYPAQTMSLAARINQGVLITESVNSVQGVSNYCAYDLKVHE